MDFDAFIAQAWADHADDAAGVAQRLETIDPGTLAEPAQAQRLATLISHVLGEHLARWQDGIACLRKLATCPACAEGSELARSLDRLVAGLTLAEGRSDPRTALEASDRVRVAALAAAHLAERDSTRTQALLRQALAEAAALPDSDPCVRSLAVTGNTVACVMEDKPGRSADERELMILAAQTARRCWALAGTWLETERAEYRLAMTWLQAGDTAQARQHAQRCLELVQDHDGDAFERFFAWEALGRVERAAGDTAGHRQALAKAREAFAALDEGDRSGCQPSLDALEGAARVGH